MNTGQRGLIHAARSCANEAARADRLGQRRYARGLRASARRALAQAAAEGSDPLIKAISSVKSAVDLAEDLPDRETDASGHDVTVKAVHAAVKSARGSLEAHLNPMNPKASRSRRRRGSGTGPSGPSGTDNDKPYDESVGGHPDLLRALDSLNKADDESDRLADLLDGNEGERDKSAADLHFHTKSADEFFQAYRDSVVNNPEEEKRRSIAKAWARTIATGLH
jgi:hypothetical protein